MVYNKGKSTFAYMAFPYSDDPKGNTLKARLLAKKIMDFNPNIFVLIPHTGLDMTLFGEFHERAKTHGVNDHYSACALEFIILDKIDLFIIGTHYTDMSNGMIWEHAYVDKLNMERKKVIDVKFAEELLRDD